MDAASDDQVKFGFQLLEAVKAGALDMASAQKQLRDLMVSGTPPPATPPGARVASTPEAARPAIPPSPGAMPKGFAPVCVAASPGACPRDSPTPSWGVKVAAARSTASSASSPAPGSDPGDAGLRAVLDDFRAVTAEAAAMCDDVVDLAEAVERDGDAPFGVGDIAEIEREAVALAAKVREETSAAGALRPQVAEVWAENTRDETMRAELESLFERAAEDVEAAAADAEAEKAEEAAEARKAREAGGSARVEDRRRREQTWGLVRSPLPRLDPSRRPRSHAPQHR